MPLNTTGFFDPKPQFQALTIYPEVVLRHMSCDPAECGFSLHGNAAAFIMAAHKKIGGEAFYLTSPPEVCTGHLDRYTNQTSTVGFFAPFAHTNPNFPNDLHDCPLQKISVPGNGKLMDVYLPQTVNRIFQEKRPLEALIFVGNGFFMMGNFDYSKSPEPPFFHHTRTGIYGMTGFAFG